MNELFNFKENWAGEKDRKKRIIVRAIGALIIVSAIFVLAQTVNTFKQFSYIGAGIPATNTVSVSGEGEMFAVPNIAEVSFSAHAEKKTMAEAQKESAAVMNAAIDFLKKSAIAEKDIKTVNYSAYPKYSYENGGSETMIYPPRPLKQVLVGYEVNQTVTVKVRDTEKAGAILDGLGKLKVSDISGPNFSIDDDNALKAAARKKAIDDAKAKAEILAGDLGVKLVRVINFSESGNYPVYYAKGMDMGIGGAESSIAPDLPKGENKITSSVTVTYEIR